MRWKILLLFASSTFVFGAAPQAPDDAARLQGSWAIVSVEIEGGPLPMDMLKNARLSVEGNRYSVRLGETNLEVIFKLDASTFPKAIDLIVLDGPDRGKIHRGIYTFEADQFKICRTIVPDTSRPLEFTTWPDSGFLMGVWRRVTIANRK